MARPPKAVSRIKISHCPTTAHLQSINPWLETFLIPKPLSLLLVLLLIQGRRFEGLLYPGDDLLVFLLVKAIIKLFVLREDCPVTPRYHHLSAAMITPGYWETAETQMQMKRLSKKLKTLGLFCFMGVTLSFKSYSQEPQSQCCCLLQSPLHPIES